MGTSEGGEEASMDELGENVSAKRKMWNEF